MWIQGLGSIDSRQKTRVWKSLTTVPLNVKWGYLGEGFLFSFAGEDMRIFWEVLRKARVIWALTFKEGTPVFERRKQIFYFEAKPSIFCIFFNFFAFWSFSFPSHFCCILSIPFAHVTLLPYFIYSCFTLLVLLYFVCFTFILFRSKTSICKRETVCFHFA